MLKMTIHLCGTIKEAQSCMENGYDLHQKDREFEERDWVYSRVQPYGQASISMGGNLKLANLFHLFGIKLGFCFLLDLEE